MTIDWIHFTPWTSLLGGALIGLSAVVLILCNGRVAGISGIVGGLFNNSRTPSDTTWRIAFIAGIVFTGFLSRLLTEQPNVVIQTAITPLIIAGVIVGFSTRLGSGCTSGHGVCGLSRFSLRSLVATCAFMATGFLTVYILQHLI